MTSNQLITTPKRLLFVSPREDGLRHHLNVVDVPEAADWQITFATGTAEAMNHLQQTQFDAVVALAQAKGLNGVALLDEVMLCQPTAVRVMRSELSRREATLACVGKAHHHLLEPCGVETLFSLLARAEALQQWLPNATVQGVMTQMQQLPSPPEVYFQIVEEMEAPEASVERVGELVAQDPALSAKMIQLANSAVFGLQLQVVHPTEAVAYLGMSTTQALVLMAHTFSYFETTIPPELSIHSLQTHALGTGRLARRIAQMEGASLDDIGQAFTAGLLHDLGKLVLAANIPKQFSKVVAQSIAERRPLWEIETQVFGASHAEIGASLLGHWGLPIRMLQAIAGHHSLELGAPEQAFSPVVAVHVANVFEHESHPNPKQRVAMDLNYLKVLDCDGHLERWRQECFQRLHAA